MKPSAGVGAGTATPNRRKVGAQPPPGNPGQAFDGGNMVLGNTSPLRNSTLLDTKTASKAATRPGRSNNLINNGIPAPGVFAHGPKLKADLRNKTIPSKAPKTAPKAAAKTKKKTGNNYIGETIAKLLKVRQDKQVDLAAACGVSGSAVHHWISGNVEPTSKHIKAAADFFDVSVEVFYPPRLKPALTAEQWRAMSQ